MECYFDNAATTRCCQEAVDFMVRALREDYGNPSSMHAKGVEAEKMVKDARAAIAATLKAQPKEILFTSGGTESNNLALAGAAEALKRKGKHLITTAAEHAAVLAPMSRLQKQGYEVTILPVDEEGLVDLNALEASLRPDTILVSVMYVNNEVGTVMPVEEAANLVHSRSQAVFHVDAIQAYGKYLIAPGKTGIDLLSVSSHKIHGPKGAGFLYVRDQVRIEPQILGGGQQGGMRSGTDNVPGIVGMAAAARKAYENLGEKREYLYTLKQRLAEGLTRIPDVFINGPEPSMGAPHILDASFMGIRSEVLLHSLEERGIYVSSGSACSSHRRKPEGVLSAMGLCAQRRESALRFSFCPDNTAEQVDFCLEQLAGVVPVLRKYSRR